MSTLKGKTIILGEDKRVFVRRLWYCDFERSGAYQYLYKWLAKVSRFLNRDFDHENYAWMKKDFLEMIADMDKNIVLGAIYEGKIVDYCKLGLNFKPRTKHVGSWSIAIHPNFQFNGLGFELIREMEEVAKKNLVKKLEASYYEYNLAAKRLYIDKLGYKIEGRRECAGYDNHYKYMTAILIGKVLNNDY